MDEEDWIRDPVDMTARDAAAQLAAQVNWWIRQKGVRPEFTNEILTRHIGRYIRLRYDHHWSEITLTYSGAMIPEGWDSIKQLLWNEWIDDTFTEEEWETAVLDPVFGSLEWTWEPRGWRSELFSHLRTWIQRSEAIVALRDHRPPPPPPLPPTEEAQQSTVDPYLAEQEERRRRR